MSARRIRELERALDQLAQRNAPEDILRRRAEIVLAQVASVSAAVLIANDYGRYIDANAAAGMLTGYTRAELLKMQLRNLTPEHPRGVGLKLWRTFLKRGRMRGKFQLRRKDGSIVMARYVAVANVLPGVHVSALTTPELIRALRGRTRRRRAPVQPAAGPGRSGRR